MNKFMYLALSSMLFVMAGLSHANQELDAATAECTAQAQEQGVADVAAFVAECVKEKQALQTDKAE